MQTNQPSAVIQRHSFRRSQLAFPKRWRVIWLALFLSLFSALAPTLSRAVAFNRQDAAPWMAICTSFGPRWAALTQAARVQTSVPDPDAPVAVLDHCPYCLLSVAHAAPPPHPLVNTVILPGRAPRPLALTRMEPVAMFALTPPARGPPGWL